MEGLQIVRLVDSTGKRYELDEAALEHVLLRPDVKDIPVMVVSVAGAYRLGKSFLLDFLLRYLKASDSEQLSGGWLGMKRSRLKGFAWRGGSERHTTGIYLWPEPITVTLQTGEKMAVLLMDTQGTFDHESTLGDNLTIFALSMLISSIQLYNLSGNIREDDLHHLQLFTEYGRMASNGKAFQKLLFLVRDWQHPHEYAYGIHGGEAVLNKKLEMTGNQVKELRDVRENIRSCFETIECFLMPHPGLVVRIPTFEGRVEDLDEEFREALLELVPYLFERQHLVPKLINGECVKAKHLFEFVKKYVELFNSKELPEAVTIFQATADTCLMAALRDALDFYQEHMEQKLFSDASVVPSLLLNWHNGAVDATHTFFNNKKKMSSQEAVDTAKNRLIEELGARLSVYNLQNEAKTAKAFAAANKVYEETVNNICGKQTLLCIHPRDLYRLHNRALKEALLCYNKDRIMDGHKDEDRIRLKKDLKNIYNDLCSTNEQNNQSAILKCHEVFEKKMKVQLNGMSVSLNVLRSYHHKALQHAVTAFNSRNIVTTETVDEHFDRLINELNARFSAYTFENAATTSRIAEAAKKVYENTVIKVSKKLSLLCLHPSDLQRLHNQALKDALRAFDKARITDGLDDEDKNRLAKDLKEFFDNLCTVNEQNNEGAIQMCRELFETKMKAKLNGVSVSAKVLRAYHDAALLDTINSFKSTRNTITKESADVYLGHLIHELGARLPIYEQENDAKTTMFYVNAKKVYENTIRNVCGELTRLCLHPSDLERLHKRALREALQSFKKVRIIDGRVDDYNNSMEKELKMLYEKLRSRNEQNNQSAILNSREIFEKTMKERLDGASVSAQMFYVSYNTAMQYAINAFKSTRNIVTKETVDGHLEHLIQELQTRLSVYNDQNKANTAKIFAAAKKVYIDITNHVCGTQDSLCLCRSDLMFLHNHAFKVALQLFDKARITNGKEDEHRIRLEKELKEFYENLSSMNELNNQIAILKCREVFKTKMKAQLNDTCVSSRLFQTFKTTALQEAINEFKSYRNIVTDRPVDEDIDCLVQEVEAIFQEFETWNTNSNRLKIQDAENTYQSYIISEWGSQMSCFHPSALKELHNTGKEKAMQDFMAGRPQCQYDGSKRELLEILQSRYKELLKNNEMNNNQAVEIALAEYTKLMDQQQPAIKTESELTNAIITTVPTVWVAALAGPIGIMVAGLFSALTIATGAIVDAQSAPPPRSERHKVAKSAALKVWQNLRRGADYSNDSYAELLEKKMEDALKKYR